MSEVVDHRVPVRNQSRKVAAASLMGTMIEWYEFYIYATAAALVFPSLFFPEFDPFVGMMLSLTTFAVAFLARPIGAVIFGHFGDRVGRKTLLVITLSLMGSATFAMGLLPSYAAIGVAAPILLALLRLIQGVSLGGEYGGAVLMSLEHAAPSRRGLFGGIINTGASLGLILANLVFFFVALLPESSFTSWGWRIPFLLSAVLIFIGMRIRLRLNESPEFAEIKKEGTVHKLPLGAVVRNHGGKVFLLCLAYLPAGAAFYLVAVFSLPYGTKTLDYSRSSLLLLVCLINLVGIAGIIFGGWLSDRMSRRGVFVTGAIGSIATPWLFFLCFNAHSLLWAFVGYLIIFIPFCLHYGALPAFFAGAFPAEIRYTGVSLALSIGTVLGSGLSPLIATALLGTDNNWTAVAIFISALAAAGALAILAIREQPETASASN